MKTYVYVLTAHYDHDGTEIVGVRSKEEHAKQFLEDIKEHDKNRPRFIRYDESENKALRQWILKHPAGKEYSADAYDYIKMPLI